MSASERLKEIKRTRRVQRFNATIIVVGGLVFLTWFVTPSAPRRGTSGVSAEPLYGTWVSRDARYADRELVIEEQTVMFGLGGGQMNTHPVRTIVGTRNGELVSYTITYVDEAEEAILTVFLHPGGVLQLNNPPDVIWRKADGIR